MSLARQFELMEPYVRHDIHGDLDAARHRPPVAAHRHRHRRGSPSALSEPSRGRRRRAKRDEKYSRSHNKVCKRLFFVEGGAIEEGDDTVEDDTEEATVETPVFSLHAVAGIPLGKPILLQVTLGAASLVALVDTGSTHNFIGEDAALRTGLPVQPRPRLTATVANGEKVSCPGVLRRAPITIQGMAFDVDLYVMPLAGYDMVLGTQWMAHLGTTIAWDVTTGTVSFQHQGRTVSWQSLPPHQRADVHAVSTGTSLVAATGSSSEDRRHDGARSSAASGLLRRRLRRATGPATTTGPRPRHPPPARRPARRRASLPLPGGAQG